MSLLAETHISHVHLRVKNLERELSFYRELLGFNEVMRYDSTVALSATRTINAVERSAQLPFQILLTESPNATPRPPRTTGLFHVAIRFPNREELAKTLRRIVQHGYPIQGAADHAVSEAIYLSDPEGNGVELYRDRPRDEWKWVNDEVFMTTEHLDVEALLREAEGKSWAGIHPLTDIGHIHLNVSNLANSEEFYHQRLGFDITTRSYPGALFFAAGGYHHHVGANVWSSRNATAPPENSTGLMSFGISVPNERWKELRAGFLAEKIEFAMDSKQTGLKTMKLRDADGINVELIAV